MSTHATSRVLVASALSAWAARAVALGSGLITLPIIVATLGAERYGVWILVGQVIGFVALGDLGIANAVGREVARALGEGNEDDARRIVATATTLLTLAGGAVAAVTFGLAPHVPPVLRIPAAHAADARTVFTIAGLSLAAQFPLRVGFGILAGHQRYAAANLSRLASAALTLAGVLGLAATRRLDLVSLAALSAIASIVTQAVMLAAALRSVGGRAVDPRGFTPAAARGLASLGASALGMSASSAIYRQGTVIATGILLGTREAGVFGVALTLATHLSALLTELPRPMVTLASERMAGRDHARLRGDTMLAMHIAMALGTSAAAGVALYAAPVLRLLLARGDWTATEFDAAANALTLMAAGLAIGLPQLVSRAVLQGTGRHWAVSRRFFLATSLALTLGIAGMRLGAGVAAAAASWALVWVLQGTVLYPPLLCRALGVTPGTMLREAYLPGAAVGLAVLVTAWGATSILPPHSPAPTIAGIVIAIAVAIVGTGTILPRATAHGAARHTGRGG